MAGTLKRLQPGFLSVIVMAVLLAGKAAAQVGTISAVPQPLSPDVAMLGKFVEVPVSNYSGLPEIKIPIYELKTKAMSVPISLSYHASGVKVADIPGWVGANFALNTGGMIMRVVRGLPDAPDLNHPDYYKLNLYNLGTPPYYWPDPRSMPDITAEGNHTKVDTEFDVFYYNFMGHTGRFTFDQDGDLLMLNANRMKVVAGGDFVITDEDGIVYEFAATEFRPWPNALPYTSTWHLSKVTIPHQKETINFTYKTYGNYWIYRSGYGPQSFYKKTLYQDIFPPAGNTQNPACQDGSSFVNSPDIAQGSACILQKIAYQNDSIKFYHDTSRADLYKVRLDSIRVFQGASPVHTTRFNYTFTGSGSFMNKKMLLSSVQSNDQPAYAFSYYTSFNGKTLPGPYIHGSDLWGYYNGGSYTIYTPVTEPHHPDYRYGQIGSIQSITYPTGGRTEYTYEGNDFSYCQNELDSVGPIYKAGGLRIKKIKFISPQGGSSSFEKNYEYKHGLKSSGVLEAPFANKTSSFYWGEGRPIYNPYCNSGSWPQVCSFYETHHDNVIPLGNAQGGAIGYAQVTENNSDGSKKVMQFTNGGFDPFTYYPKLDPLFDGWADGYNNQFIGDVLIQNRLSYDYSSFRGKLKYAAYYNSSGQKIRQEIHKFSDLIGDRLTFMETPKNQSLYAIFNDATFSNRCPVTGQPDYGTAWSGYYCFQRNVVPVVDSIYTFKGTDTLKEVIKYDYNTAFHTEPSRIIKTGTRGDSTITYFKYPYDIVNSSGDAIGQGLSAMRQKNVLSQPIETYVVKKDAGGGNARVTDAQLIAFSATSAQPATVYRISNTAGLTDFAPLVMGVTPSVRDSRYQPKLQFHNYDSFGNVKEQSKEGDSKEVLIWGYQHKNIVARISSSTYATVIALIDTNIVNNPSSDAALRTELAKIRTSLGSTNPKAKVTTYTHASLLGITSTTDPRGETTYYEYDTYGRLKRRKDASGNTKENIWYNYQH